MEYLFTEFNFSFIYITFTFLIFHIGVSNILLKRDNIILILLSFEILYLCSTLIFSLSAYENGLVDGLIFIIYTITIAGAEACVGLSIVTLYYLKSKELSLGRITLLKL